MLTGILIGFVNGVLIAKVRLPAFIATYGMNWIVTGAATAFMMGTAAHSFAPWFRNIFIGRSGIFPNSVLIMSAILLIVGFLLNKTVFGRCIYAYGFNRTAARFSRIPTNRNVLIIYTLSGFLAAFTGIMYMAKLDAADANLNEGWNIKLIAAVLVGGASMSGGKACVLNAFMGSLIMVMLNTAINLMNISSLWQQFVIGAVILISVFIHRPEG